MTHRSTRPLTSMPPLLLTGLALLATPGAASGQRCILSPGNDLGQQGVVRQVPARWIQTALELDPGRETRLGDRPGDGAGYGPGADLPYDLRVTSNLGRLQAEVYFQLARQAADRGESTQLFVRSHDWFHSYLLAAGVDSAQAPPSARNSLAHGQGIQLDIRPDRVVKRLKKGGQVRFAMNVRTWWPSEGAPSRYTYRDSLSQPPLQVTSKQEIRYRLLDLGDMVVYDKIEGSSGKPLEGFLSFLFDAFGEANLKQSRMALSDDGLLVVRGTGKWIIKKSRTFVVHPDGSVGDVPDDRPDLKAIQARLEEDLDVDYHDYDWGCNTESAPLPWAVAQAASSSSNP